MPDPARLLNTLHKAADLFRRMPGRTGRLVELNLQEIEDVLVVGDLHGHVENFRKLLDFADLGRNTKRHFVVQELIHPPEGNPESLDQSHRLVDLVAAVKCLYPTRVHYLLGNHELSQWTDRTIAKGDADLNRLFRKGVRTSYGPHADDIYDAYKWIFRVIPAAVRLPNRVFLAHTCPGMKRLGDWSLLALEKESLVESDVELGGPLHAAVWGRDTAPATLKKYLQMVDADLLVSGHIPCEDGHAVPNPQQLILDCKDERGSAVLIPCAKPLTQAELLQGIVKVKNLR